MSKPIQIITLIIAAQLLASGQGSPPTSSSGMARLLVTHADVPTYPPLCRAAQIDGVVEVDVTVKEGTVTATEVKSGPKLLIAATTENIKTWRFDSQATGAFVVRFVYELKGAAINEIDNPTIELKLPGLVRITATPYHTTPTP